MALKLSKIECKRRSAWHLKYLMHGCWEQSCHAPLVRTTLNSHQLHLALRQPMHHLAAAATMQTPPCPHAAAHAAEHTLWPCLQNCTVASSKGACRQMSGPSRPVPVQVWCPETQQNLKRRPSVCYTRPAPCKMHQHPTASTQTCLHAHTCYPSPVLLVLYDGCVPLWPLGTRC
jgi:hypothetical protein